MSIDPLHAHSDLRLGPDGAEWHSAALSAEEQAILCASADAILKRRSGGVRLTGGEAFARVLGADGGMGRIAVTALGAAARPVRAILFDKTADSNWIVPWHQDRTIAVRERLDVPGFGPWSIKSGLPHVEPPFALLEGMVTLRAHLDDCDADNAPLLIARGSHRLGRVPSSDVAAIAERIGMTACLARARDVWMYATPVLHASDRARTPRRRRVLHVDYTNASLPGGLEWSGISGRTE